MDLYQQRFRPSTFSQTITVIYCICLAPSKEEDKETYKIDAMKNSL